MYPCGTAQASSTSSEPNAAQPWLHSDMPRPSEPCRALTSHWVTCWLALLQLSIFCLLLCSIEQRALAVVNDRLLDLSWSLLQIQKFCKSDVWYAWWSHFETGLFKIFPFFVFFFFSWNYMSQCMWALKFIFFTAVFWWWLMLGILCLLSSSLSGEQHVLSLLSAASSRFGSEFGCYTCFSSLRIAFTSSCVWWIMP